MPKTSVSLSKLKCWNWRLNICIHLWLLINYIKLMNGWSKTKDILIIIICGVYNKLNLLYRKILLSKRLISPLDRFSMMRKMNLCKCTENMTILLLLWKVCLFILFLVDGLINGSNSFHFKAKSQGKIQVQ